MSDEWRLTRDETIEISQGCRAREKVGTMEHSVVTSSAALSETHFFVGEPLQGERHWQAIVYEAKSRDLPIGGPGDIWAIVLADSADEVLERARMTTRYLNARRMMQ